MNLLLLFQAPQEVLLPFWKERVGNSVVGSSPPCHASLGNAGNGMILMSTITHLPRVETLLSWPGLPKGLSLHGSAAHHQPALVHSSLYSL